MSYYEDRIKALEARIEEMATLNRMKAVKVEANLMIRIGELNAENARLKAEVERLTQAAEWQPIQTAPKNYTKILCLWPIKTAYRDSKGYWSRDEMDWWDKHEGELPKPILWKPLPEGWDNAAKEGKQS